MKRALIKAAIAGLVLGALTVCYAQEPAGTNAAGTPSATRLESNRTLWDLIKSGGWAMWPLGACSVLTVSLVLLNFQRVNAKRMVPLAVIGEMKAAAGSGNISALWTLAKSHDSFFTNSFAAGLKHINPDDPAKSRQQMEAAIGETASQEETRYAFFINFLALLTSMSPMWGLLGTVSGMIGAFSKIGAGGMGKPEMLARNIGEALICTATGLLIAITAMGFYFLFRNLLNTVMKEAEKHFTELLDLLTGTGTLFQSQPAKDAAEPR